jgi:zinc transporter ZupT
LALFLVIGFILQNVTEGLGIVVPISHDRPRLGTLAWLCLIGGAPAILGTWIGGLTDSLALMVLFLAIGAGAVFQVAYEVGRQLVWKDAASNEMPLTAFSGVLAGMMILYITGLAIK